MNSRRLLLIGGLLGATALVALMVGGVVLLRAKSTPAENGRLAGDLAPSDPAENEAAAADIDPALIQYEQTVAFPTGLHQVTALAVAHNDQIYVGGDKVIRRFSPDGKQEAQFALAGEPKCLAVGSSEHVTPGRIYVGMADHVEVFDPSGQRLATWKTLGEKAIVTSIAAADRAVFVADAGNRIVWHYGVSGELRGRIGDPNQALKIPGFLITSHYFDLAVGVDDLLYVVNPRALRLEGYTFTGDLELFWGKGSPTIEGFFGCCNPAHFAVLPDGRFVTAEKGSPRIKIYSPQGKFQCVVAGPRQVGVTVADVAADSRARILALDPSAASVRIFEPVKTSSGEKR